MYLEDVRRLALLLLLAGCKEKEYFAPLKGVSPEVEELARWGDRLFAQAVKRMESADPGQNHAAFLVANKEALELFTRALKEGYEPAEQALDPKAQVPAELAARSRETRMRQFFCRKLGVSSR